MDIEFHYFMTYLIALRAGFKKKDAYTIAWASQYTDDNTNKCRILDEQDGGWYLTYMSQTMNIALPQADMLNVYPMFHFCPGTENETDDYFKQYPRKDMARGGTSSPLVTIPDNSNAKSLFKKAIESRDLHRLGLGTHMFADTFCHRDFAGCEHDFNYLEGKLPLLKKILGELPLCIGHAFAMHDPDTPALLWADDRLKNPEKENRAAILRAAGRIFDEYASLNGLKKATSVKETLLGDLSAAMGEPSTDTDNKSDNRVAAYKDLLKSALSKGPDPLPFEDYAKNKWYDAAVTEVHSDPSRTSGTDEIKYIWKKGYQAGDWYKFQESVKKHHEDAFSLLKPIFDKVGLTKKIEDCIHRDNTEPEG